MCTVTYIPGQKGIYLTSNRDEHLNRAGALPPRSFDTAGGELIYPTDRHAGGTWITLKGNGDAAVLLNGARVKHQRQTPYRKSRGLVFLDLLQVPEPQQHFASIELTGIEPFTLVLFIGGLLWECCWDGVERRRQAMDPSTPHLWSSVTLYEPSVREKRQAWFRSWQQTWQSQGPSHEDIFRFHRKAGEGNREHDLVMHRETTGMRTVSITSVFISPQKTYMRHFDLGTAEETTRTFKRKTAAIKWKAAWIRLTHWEYWPFHVLYAPVYWYWLWLSLKARSLFFFNAANPTIENGGWLMEKKSDIYPLLPKDCYPPTLLCQPGEKNLKDLLESKNLQYPLIAKPDIGMRGIGVQRLLTPAELHTYSHQSRVPFLLQAFVDYPLEAGIFYYRLPDEPTGHLSGIVGKIFLTVTGDGYSTIEELLMRTNRHLLQLPALRKTYGDRLTGILPADTREILVPYGNHSRGALFTDLSHRITPGLTATIDRICREIPGFYFGRLDIRFLSWEALEAGESFSIIEVNGAGSEPTHIYDPGHSIFYAWKEICRHLTLLYRISKSNSRRQKIAFFSLPQGLRLLRANADYLKKLQA